MVDPGVALGSFSTCSMQIANESLSNTWGRRRLVVLLCLMFDLTSLLCVPRLLRRCAIFILASNPFYISVFFGGPVEEKAFTDLVKRWKLSRMGVISSASVSGTRKTCWLECSGSLCVPSSACLVVRRYGTLHAHDFANFFANETLRTFYGGRRRITNGIKNSKDREPSQA